MPFDTHIGGMFDCKTRRDFPKSAEGVLHTSPRQGESPIVPIWRNAKLMPLHPLPTEYIIPPVTPGIPYWTARVCVTRSNETPQSLPLALATPGIPYLDHGSMRHLLQ